MSVFWRGTRRDAFPIPPIPPNSEAGGFGNIRRVDLSRAESSLQKVAVFASVNLLASLGSELPINVYSGEGGERKRVTPPAWFDDIGGEGRGTPDWLYQAILCAGLVGNAIGVIGDRDSRTGRPSLIDLQHPNDVRIQCYPSQPDRPDEWFIRGKRVDRDKIWHWRRYPMPGQTMSLSPIALHATTIGLGISATNFGAQWFVDGAHPSAVLTNDRVSHIDQDKARTVKDRFMAAVRGTREPVVLGGGWKYQQIQIAPRESQFLETQGYTASECARIYGPGMPEILGYETGKKLTYANIEQHSLDLLQFTFDPWFRGVERFLSALLPKPWYARYNRKALLQTDTLTRYEAYETALQSYWQVINEIRNEEDLPPVEWGNAPFLPAAPAPSKPPTKGTKP